MNLDEKFSLTQSEVIRYNRQIIIDNFGETSQVKLRNSKVAVIGVGGLGCPAALYLAAAGIGKLILIDDQYPDLSNLNRQILYWKDDLALKKKKVESAALKLKELNDEVEISIVPKRLSLGNANTLLTDVDVILDCTDNSTAKVALNSFCVAQRKPLVHAGVESMHGQITTIKPPHTPCLNCFFSSLPSIKSEIAILGGVAGVFGSMQAVEAIKLITGIGRPLFGRLLTGNLSSGVWEEIEIEKNPSCNVCSGL
ncbi:MAG: HesA/MoeB/ThiF family protein [Methanomassiliicoccales archaeon]